jgi:hypothetical protein
VVGQFKWLDSKIELVGFWRKFDPVLVAENEWFRTGRKPFQSREVAVVVKGSSCICESKEYKVGDLALMRGVGGKAFAVESESIAYGRLLLVQEVVAGNV